ncbi:MAG: sugar transferase [Candidatus Saccharicenans sp.]
MRAYQKWGKRLFDITLSVISLVFLSPLCILISLGILIEDGRPIIFKQKRVGKDGKQFIIYKFRSMAKNLGDIPSAEAKNVYITRVGGVIRRLSLDELPQLVNVIKGDMSIVGPRAPLPSQGRLCQLRKDLGAMGLRPGLTGLAQVNSYDGMPEDEKAKWDSIYAKNISLTTDLSIIMRTFLYVLKPPPVY